MFLCDKCHDATMHFDPFGSKGPCEGCGRTARCLDCKYRDCKPPKKPVAPKDKRWKGKTD